MNIADVIVENPKCFIDERGKLMRMVRKDSSLFDSFAEVYFSVVNPGVIKGWKEHFEMTQLFSCPTGQIKLVLYDNREKSSTYQKIQEVYFGEEEHKLIKIPPQIMYAFQCISEKPAVIVNCTNLIHNPEESKQTPLENSIIKYKW